MSTTPSATSTGSPQGPVGGRPTIQQLLAVPPEQHDLAWLRQALQWAIELELTTIPPYLCAMWSIASAAGPVYDRLYAIVLDEMFHLGLACNMLTTVGGAPRIAFVDTAPKFPCALPGHVRPGLVVGLQKLSKDAVLKTFMEVEHPDWQPLALVAGEAFATIGALYEAVEAAFDALPPGTITGARQVVRGARLFAIETAADAKTAIDRIRAQGEGTRDVPDPQGVMAHYYRFAEIWHGHELVKVGPKSWTFAGPAVPFPDDADILPMTPAPAGGSPESRDFDLLYSDLLRTLQSAWGSGGGLGGAVDKMLPLTDSARALMKHSLGPSFAFLA